MLATTAQRQARAASTMVLTQALCTDWGSVRRSDSPYPCWSKLLGHVYYFSVSCMQTTSFHLIHTYRGEKDKKKESS